MAEYEQATYRGVLIPDHRITPEHVDSTQSSYTQSGPHPGIPDPTRDTDCILQTAGEMSASASYDVLCTLGGHPGRDGAGFVHKNTSDGATSYRGQEPPQPMLGWQCPDLNTLASVRTQRGIRWPHAITLDDDTVLVVYCNNDATNGTVGIYSRAESTGTWTAVGTIDTEASASTYERHACLVELPSGRVLCFAVTYFTNAAGTTSAQVMMLFSDDSGATWTVGSNAVLPTPLVVGTNEPSQLRAAYDRGQICMVLTCSATDIYNQYASDDLGCRFTLVESTALGVNVAQNCDIIALPSGGFLLSDNTITLTTGFAIRIDSAFQPASTGTPDTELVGGAIVASHGLQFAKDQNGTIYAYGLETDVALQVAVSYDEGVSWTAMGDTFAVPNVFDSADANYYVQRYSATWQRGRVLLVHNWESTEDTYDNSLGCMYLGGYSQVTMPLQNTAYPDARRCHWMIDWAPLELPGTMSWTAAGAAAVEALASSGAQAFLNLHTAAGASRTYTRAVATWNPSLAKGIIATAIWSRQAGTPGIVLNIDDGVDDYGISIVLDAANISLLDVNGAAVLQAQAASNNTYYQVIVALSRTGAAGTPAEVYAWYRSWTIYPDKQWSVLGSSAAVTRAAGGGANYSVQFGNYDPTGLVACESQFVQVSYTQGDETGLQLSNGQTNPTDLAPRRLSTVPSYLYGDLKLAAIDGPAFVGDSWDIDPRYDYPIENIYPHIAPSPQDVWRSSSTAADQTVAWAFHSQAANGEDWPSDLLGVYYEGNSPQVLIQTRATPAAAWVTRITADLTTAVNWTRAGESLELTYLATALRLEEDELAGCTFTLDNPATIYRKIARNTAGYLQSSGAGTYRCPRLYCEDLVVGDAASGTGLIFHRRALLVVQLAGLQFSGLRVQLGESTLPPVDTYFEAATCLVGPVYLLGHDPSHTRGRTWTANASLDDDRSGRSRSQVYGPIREESELAWTEGVATKQLYAGSADYILGSDVASAEPVAMRRDAPDLLRGLQRYLDGHHKVAVYIPRLPHLTTACNTFARHQAGGARLIRFTSPLDIQTLRGTEEESEVLRCSISYREEV